MRNQTDFLGFGSKLLSVLLVLGTLGCETLRTDPSRGGPVQTKSVLPVASSRMGHGSGALLLVADFRETVAGGAQVKFEKDLNCRWRLTHQESGKSVFLNLKAAEPNVFMAMDPGVYQTGRLGCGLSKVWDVDSVFKDGLKVEDGVVSYVGQITFVFTKGELATVRKNGRGESALAFAGAVEGTEANGRPIVSAFTGKKIESSMLRKDNGANDIFDIVTKGLENPAKSVDSLMGQLKTCAKTETQADPLRFGRLEYVALYKEGRFNEMKSRDEANGFSDQFRSCVERSLMAFHPVAKIEVEVRVRY